VIISWLIPIQVIALIVWWFYLAIFSYDTEGWWNPFHVYSVGTCLLQWGAIMLLFIVFNKWMVRKTFARPKEA